MPYFRTWAPFFGLSIFLCVCISEAALPQSLQTSTQDGLKLLHKMQTALGGAERIAAIHDYEETVRAEVPATPTCFTSTAPQGQGGR